MSNIKELGDQQIKHQIYLKFYSYRLLFSKRKVPIYTQVFKFKYLPTFLYRALLLKETKIVQEWPRPDLFMHHFCSHFNSIFLVLQHVYQLLHFCGWEKPSVLYFCVLFFLVNCLLVFQPLLMQLIMFYISASFLNKSQLLYTFEVLLSSLP